MVAEAVPPIPGAAVNAVRLIVPLEGAGVTLVRSRPVTVPSASDAVTFRVPAVPWRTKSVDPQVTVTS